MRGRWLLGLVAVGLVAVWSHGQPPERPQAAGKAQPAEAQNSFPEELDALNRASRKLYAGGRSLELSTIPAVIIVSGDELILRLNGKRTAVTVIPTEYHSLKCVAHSALALFGHLSHEPGKPLGAERLKALKEYRDLLAATAPAVAKCGFDADTLTRQKRIIDRGLEFIDKIVKDGQVVAEDLTKYCRASRVDLMANCAAAARAQLQATHKQVMAWKKDMTAAEWAALTVIVQGAQTPRVENAAMQYFARLFGEGSGEGRRVVYAEALWDEDKALSLLGTLRLDGKLAVAVFNDPGRMYRDILADVGRAALDEIFAAP